MNAEPKQIREKFLYEIWAAQQFNGEITNDNGEKIEIIDPGTNNDDESGPDFKNARLKIGNFSFVGDVEIDGYHADWKNHGHHFNNRFNKVILHVTLQDSVKQRYVFTRNGRKVPSISFSDLLDNSIRKALQQSIENERDKRINRMPCHNLSHMVPREQVLEIVRDHGAQRFKKKCERMVDRLRELLYVASNSLREPSMHYDIPEEEATRKLTPDEVNNKGVWEQLFYQCVLESFGYSQNKSPMYKLSKAVDLNFLRQFKDREDFIELAEAVYFHVAGLLPAIEDIHEEETSEYLRKMNELWVGVRDSYDSKVFEKEDWNYFKLRPQNFPTMRLAAAARFADTMVNHDLMKELTKKFVEVRNLRVLKNSARSLFIVKAEGYWSAHYLYNKRTNQTIKYFIGSNRADEIIVNVLLPYIYVYYDIFGRKELAEKAFAVFCNISSNVENSLVKEISNSLNLDKEWKKPIHYQGMIELYRSMCTKKRCKECKIGKTVFEEVETPD